MKILTTIMSMDDETWARHAHPLSVWTRVITGIPVIVASLWSIKIIGWWSVIVLAMSCAWLWLNPRIFPAPEKTDNWASKVTFGERVWLNRAAIPIPSHHQKWAIFLSIVAGIGFLLAVIGAVFHLLVLTISGALISWLGKMWFCDRMVWLYEDMRCVNEQYASWLIPNQQ